MLNFSFMFKLRLITVLVWIYCLETVYAGNPIVEIADGKILGRELVTPQGKNYYAFQGIPFAAPPLGDLRFAEPQAPTRWNETKDCSNRSIICIQSRIFISELESEDCLFLNVYTPKLAGHANQSDLAVMVYFYGGAFYIGNSTIDAYGPDFLIEHDVVVVTTNYRLGAFGFLSTVDSVIPGNFGLKDQQFALKWVKNNIRVFGGDPEKVTIFGNSAGAASVGLHILNKESAGLFRAGIMSSGTPLNSWCLQRHPRKVAYLTAHLVNDSKILNSSNELLQFLRSVPARMIRKASLDVMAVDPFELDMNLNGFYYTPVNDVSTKSGFLKDPTYELLENGDFSRVPLMMGITSEEYLTDKMENLKKLMKIVFGPELIFTDRFKGTVMKRRK
ncbi:hypothetical protein HHI36_011099 [Cryptolaemus montrouzieri]|uniref:Carboxylic ester hydrolase n=1 Tax=Cryptolaemus montrouzieri TaxID=559131 RepID=A0ABD2MKN8_9CUCU